MREKTAERHFKKCYRIASRAIRHNGMTITRELERAGKKLVGKTFLGVFPQDQVPAMAVGESAIINNHSHDMVGEHWTAGVMTKQGLLVFDSFGRDLGKLLPILSKQVKILTTDPDRDQRYVDENCGQLSLAWLCLVKKHGVNAGKLI